MDIFEEMQFGNFQDIWSFLVIVLAENLLDTHGIEGEVVLRKAIREYGKHRGKALRKKHVKLGLKPNLFNLFSYYDVPGDPRFRRRKISLTSQERLSETLVCTVADLWKKRGSSNIGRIYCEEVHHAIFSSYAPKAQTNLGQVLTQEGENHCRFSVYLRPGNMNKKERKESFEEYDPKYNREKTIDYKPISARDGFEMLCLKFYYYCTVTAIALFGTKGKETINKVTVQFIKEAIEFLKSKASEQDKNFNKEFFEANFPIGISKNGSADRIWESFENKEPKAIFKKNINNMLLFK